MIFRRFPKSSFPRTWVRSLLLGLALLPGPLAAEEKTAADELAAGKQMQQTGNLPGAVEHLKTAVKLDPALLDAYLLLSRIQTQQGRDKDALQTLQQAVKQQPDNPAGLVALGRLLTHQTHYTEAETVLRQAIDKSGASADASFALAECFDAQGRYYDAVKQYQRVLEINPTFEKAHYSIGCSFQNGGFFDLALEEYKKEVKLGTSIPDLYRRMGLCAAKIGATDEAVENLNKAVSLDTKDADAYYGLGIVYGQLTQNDKAIAAFNRCIELKAPVQGAAYYNIGFIYESQKQFDKAADAYEKAAALDPKDLDSRYGLARILTERKDAEKALDLYRKIAAMPGNTSPEKAYALMADLYNQANRANDALESVQTALQKNPDYAPALVQKAVALLKTRQIEAAKTSLLRAVELDETDHLAHFTLAQCFEYNKEGKRYGPGADLQKAMLHYKICLEIQPSYSAAFENLSTLMEMQEKAAPGAGDVMEAEQELAAGKRLFKNRDYNSAMAHLEKAQKLAPDNAEVARYIDLCHQQQNAPLPAAGASGEVDAIRTINSLLSQGQTFMVEERYDAAIEQWEKILKINSGHALAKQNITKAKNLMESQLLDIKGYFTNGQKLMDRQDYPGALVEFNKILTLNPPYREGVEYVNKVQPLVFTLIKKLKEQKDLAPRVITEANNLVVEGRYDEAIEILKKALPQVQNNTAIQEKIRSTESLLQTELASMQKAFTKAQELAQGGKITDAIFELNRIIALNPQYAQGREILEKARTNVDQWMHQVQSTKQAVTDYLLEGEKLFTQGQYLEAMAKWKSVLSLDPANAMAKGNIERTQRALDEGRRQKEATDNALMQATMAMQKKDMTTAITYLNKVLAVDPHNEQATHLLQQVNAVLHESEQADRARQVLIRGHLDAAQKFIQQNQPDEAIRELQTVLTIDPDHAESKAMIQSILQNKQESTRNVKRRALIENLLREQIPVLENKFLHENAS